MVLQWFKRPTLFKLQGFVHNFIIVHFHIMAQSTASTIIHAQNFHALSTYLCSASANV